MSKYYVGQKLLCIKSSPDLYLTSGKIYELLEIDEEISIVPYKITNDYNDTWLIVNMIEKYLIDGEKYLLEQAFNSKFDDWINNE